jgi:preprotein translocase subunit SecA
MEDGKNLMFGKVLTRVFGTRNERVLRELWPQVEEINRVWESMKGLSLSDLPRRTEGFKARIADGEDLDSMLPEAYALLKEACRLLLDKSWPVCGLETRWDMVPFDEQLLGAIVLHEGRIAEMKTGEGKTLVATMPLYLNALTGKGAHLVTVNDYLVTRDRQWMGPIFESLGLTVGYVATGMEPQDRRPQYEADVTYATNNELGFDYLRDNMVWRPEDRVQRGYHYAIVDEVDIILIDEARTPLIISGPVEGSSREFDTLSPRVRKVYDMQMRLVNRMADEAKREWETGDQRSAALKLLQARRGAPRNPKLLAIEKEQGVMRQIEQMENEFRQRKALSEVDRDLYFSVDEKSNVVDISDKGRAQLAPDDPDFFTVPDLSTALDRIDKDDSLDLKEKLERKQALDRDVAERQQRIHDVQQLLKAFTLFERDVQYVVQEGRVIIVDEFTGRLMYGRRYSDGLHEAIEAKEGLQVQEETQTVATITLQNYFRMYDKLAGMTGTAMTEAFEFTEVYDLDVVEIPTHEPVRRIDQDDVIFKTKREKYEAVVEDIDKQIHQDPPRPILVGTVSVEVSEQLSRMLAHKGITHSVLNAKHHQREAEIISHAGEKGRVTIATNMAGRGTDIKLGQGVVMCDKCCIICTDKDCEHCSHEPRLNCSQDVPCGLHVIGTERHEARRIDLQLRGRSGRQGDPGSSRFYMSLEDDLMRLFGSDRIAGIMDRFGVAEGEAIVHPLVTKAIGVAQRRVEQFNLDIRKRLLEYDDVMNRQREVIYELRNQALDRDDLKDWITEQSYAIVEEIVWSNIDPKQPPSAWDWDGLRMDMLTTFFVDLEIRDGDKPSMRAEEVLTNLKDLVRTHYGRREEMVSSEEMRRLERLVMLRVIDSRWRDHLYEIDALKEGIGLRGYAQKDPLVEYKRESFVMFEDLVSTINQDIIRHLFGFRIVPEERAPRASQVRAYKPETSRRSPEPEHAMAAQGQSSEVRQPARPQPSRRRSKRRKRDDERQEPGVTYHREEPKVGRNDPCPCGSGKKYKHCCGKK